MKILTIMGTPHQGNTRAVTDLFLKEFESADIKLDEIILPNDFREICCGCANCIVKGESTCPHFHAVEPLIKKIEDADLIIIASPVFAMSCSSGLKAFFDHLAYLWLVHRPRESMFHKVGLIITTAGGSGVKSTIDLIKNNMFYWGIPAIYQYSITTMKMGGNYIHCKIKDKIGKQVKQKASKIKRRLLHRKIGLKTRLFFRIFKMTQKNGWNPTDSDYWREKGWLDRKTPYENR